MLKVQQKHIQNTYPVCLLYDRHRQKRGPECEVQHSSQSNAKVKNGWNCTSAPLYVFVPCKWTAVRFRNLYHFLRCPSPYQALSVGKAYICEIGDYLRRNLLIIVK